MDTNPRLTGRRVDWARGEARRLGARRLALAAAGLLTGLLGLGLTGCLYDWPTSIIPDDGGGGDSGAECGNGRIEPGEACDGTRLAGETCASQGFGGGTLGCTEACAFDTSACVTDEVCGDGAVGPNEECDDGDTGDGDGCDAQCDVEPGWACEGEPSVCSDGCGNGVCYGPGGEDAETCPADCGWLHLSAGRVHTCGVKGDGTVWCWGENGDGQLGDGSGQDQAAPVQVPGVPAALKVAAGDRHTCALARAGTIWCWGDNADGQLGDETIIDRPTPVQVAGIFDGVDLAAGGAHTCAVTVALEALCWGRNTDGQLGDGTPTSRQAPVGVAIGAGLTSARRVTCGAAHTCAQREDDTVWCWGQNASGQLGTGSTQGSLLPLPVETAGGFGTASVVDAGVSHTCAVDGAGQLWCWGNGGDRRLGDGATQNRTSPVDVITVGAALGVAAGGSHSCAVDTGGGLWCWGAGTSGQLGGGNPVNRADPTAVQGLSGGAAVTAGETHTCAVLGDRRAYCWGAGSSGQLGQGTPTGSASALSVVDPY